ncbi:MAG: GNAT family N-acetyltransferase, partial [Lawsonibacter sp.]|nr:GNAT family N-acetyltransferase [Lawsonibacter sp.]
MENLKALFAHWDSPMVGACLQGRMGRILPLGQSSALASIGDFCFLAGEPSPELVERADAPILVPGSAGWEEVIRAVLGERAVPFTRYATRQEPEHLQQDRLIHFTRSLPQGFIVRPIGREMYFTLMEEEWARDLCGCFADASDFLEQGLGFVVTHGGLLVAGASSYSACDG